MGRFLGATGGMTGPHWHHAQHVHLGADGQTQLVAMTFDRIATVAQFEVTEPSPLIGQITQPTAQGRARRTLRLVAHHLAIRARNLARPPF